MKLSIITPYYKTIDSLKELAEILQPQLTKEVEWIIVDDGCHEKKLDNLNAIVVHLPKNSGGASTPRNVGLDIAKGKYIAFIDADDLVSENYIEKILEKTKEEWEYCYIGWKSDVFEVLIEDLPPAWNCSVWNCIYKRSLIGKKRFSPKLRIGEDYNFNNRVRRGGYSHIKEYLYFYRDTPNSLMKSGDNKV